MKGKNSQVESNHFDFQLGRPVPSPWDHGFCRVFFFFCMKNLNSFFPPPPGIPLLERKKRPNMSVGWLHTFKKFRSNQSKTVGGVREQTGRHTENA